MVYYRDSGKSSAPLDVVCFSGGYNNVMETDMNTNMVQLSEAIAADVATLGWNARPEGWVWVCFNDVAAWVHPEWVSRLLGVVEE